MWTLRRIVTAKNGVRRSFSSRVMAPFGKAPSSSQPANPLPAYFIRGGTSKGLFINANDMGPLDGWPNILLGAIGSPDPYGRQLNGMGGGISSLSKVVLVDRSNRPGVDVEGLLQYEFVQVGIQDSVIDTSGNCGNLSSAVGPYALATGLYDASQLDPEATSLTMTVYNTNTKKRIQTTFPVRNRMPHLADPSSTFSIDGVAGTASKITMDYLSPGGSRTGRLFPTGNKIDIVRLPDSDAQVRLTLIDCTNPTVLVLASELGVNATTAPQDISRSTLTTLEYLRASGAHLMGLDPTAQAQPKIAFLGPPESQSGNDKNELDLVARALSMQQPHKAIPLTLAMAIAAAAKIDGTLAHEVARRSDGEEVRIGHPSGRVVVGAEMSSDGEVRAVKAYRTARFLMRGEVYW
ncbi:hypothetical protein FRB99_003060 [Tulasnella sp. 403]|nr:hypothetical protein FRB99_003060 [Tulasnella sp. 403]